MLHPIFEEASNIVREEFPNTKQVVFARVDCDQHCEYIFTFYILFLKNDKKTAEQPDEKWWEKPITRHQNHVIF